MQPRQANGIRILPFHWNEKYQIFAITLILFVYVTLGIKSSFYNEFKILPKQCHDGVNNVGNAIELNLRLP